MNPMEGTARQMQWVGRNTAYNLGFIPADKLNWKPAPTASSALEIVGHVVGFIKAMRPVLDGAQFTPPQFTPPTTLQQAQDLVTSSAEDYAGALQRLKPEDLGKSVKLPFGEFPLAQVDSM